MVLDGLPRYIGHAQIIQLYACECHSNSVDWHKSWKSYRQRRYNRRCQANPTDKYASQCSGAPSHRPGAPLHCTSKHICKLDLQGIADYRSLLTGLATLDNLRCWQDNHLHTNNLILQDQLTNMLASWAPLSCIFISWICWEQPIISSQSPGPAMFVPINAQPKSNMRMFTFFWWMTCS